MYGFAPGHSATATGQAALVATMATPATASWRSRVPSAGGPASRYAAPSAGTIIQPCSIFVMNARPTSAPHHARCFVRPDSSARTSRWAAPTMSRTSSASGLLTRAIATVTGVSASAVAAAIPATGPNARRTVACSRPTAAIVQSAWGSRRLNDEKPSTRADRPISQSESGGLSTVMKLPGSSEPKNQAVQLSLPARAAAA